MKRVRVVVTGRVQGVGFRWATLQRAQTRGVAGSVQNTSQGNLEAVFEGESEAVDALVAWCRSGPSGARVDAVTVELETPIGEKGFRAD